MKCIICNKESGRSVFCRGCRETKGNATAIFVQNKKKLQELLRKEFCNERMGKFALYTKNIIQYGKVILSYQEKKRKKIFGNNLDVGDGFPLKKK